MTYIHFDESGDLGFDFSKTGTSSHFVIAFLISENKRPISKLVRKVFLTLPSAVKRKSNGVLHACNEKPGTVKKLLTGMVAKDVRIATIRLDKHKVLIMSNPSELYADIVISLVNRLYADGVFNESEHIELIASQCNTSRSLNERFSRNVMTNMIDKKFTVSIVKPADDKCLQAVDFVSWAFWQKYTKGDGTFSDIISGKVISEYEMYS